MRLVSEVELKKVSAGNRAITKSVITISGLIISGSIYLLASEDLELSCWSKAGISIVGLGMIGSILFL